MLNCAEALWRKRRARSTLRTGRPSRRAGARYRRRAALAERVCASGRDAAAKKGARGNDDVTGGHGFSSRREFLLRSGQSSALCVPRSLNCVFGHRVLPTSLRARKALRGKFKLGSLLNLGERDVANGKRAPREKSRHIFEAGDEKRPCARDTVR